jgi:hypothetical protein
MNRLAIGAALGGLAVYLYDPESGENRRGRLSALWTENRNGALQAGRTASETIESARPLARRITKAIGRGDWTLAPERRRPSARLLPVLIGAAAFGGTVVYFMDPLKGPERRLAALGTARAAGRKIANIVEPVKGHVRHHVTVGAERVKARVS